MSLRDAIRAARRCVGADGEYISSMEIRTRYALIDPILQALGWNLNDPSQVRIEHETTDQPNPHRVDYALFSMGQAVILVEAKPLHKEYPLVHAANRAEDRARVEIAWGKFQCGEEIPNSPPISAIWRDLTAEHERQLKDYVEQLKLESGYAVLTNGADWRISDLAESGKYLTAINILFDAPRRYEKILGVLRRGGSG